MWCRGDAFLCCFSIIELVRLHYQFILATTDQNTFIDFFHHRCTLHIHSPYNQLCMIHQAPVMSTIEFYTHLLWENRTVGMIPCHLVRPQHHHSCLFCCCIYTIIPCALMTAMQSFLRHSSAQGLRPTSRVFIIELLLPILSLSPAYQLPLVTGPARRFVRSCTANSLSNITTPSTSPSHPHLLHLLWQSCACCNSRWDLLYWFVPSDANTCLGPLPCMFGIGNTSTWFCPWHVAGFSKPHPHLGPSVLTALTLLFLPYLSRLHHHLSSMSTMALTVSTSASPPSTTTILICLRHYCGTSWASAAPST